MATELLCDVNFMVMVYVLYEPHTQFVNGSDMDYVSVLSSDLFYKAVNHRLIKLVVQLQYLKKCRLVFRSFSGKTSWRFLSR